MPNVLNRAFERLLAGGANLTERLPFLGLMEGVVFLRGGGCEFGLTLSPPSRLETAGERLTQMSEALRYALSSALPEGARLRVVCESGPLGPGEGAPSGQGGIEGHLAQAQHRQLETVRSAGQLAQLRFYLSVHCPTEQRPSELSYLARDLERHLALACERRRRLCTLLEGVGLRAAVMTDAAIFAAIWRYLNPAMRSSPPPRYVPAFGTGALTPQALRHHADLQFATLRRQVLGGDLETGSLGSVGVGGHRVLTVLLTQFGEGTGAGQLEGLLQRLAGASFHVVLEATVADQQRVRFTLGKASRGASLDNRDDSLGVPDAGNVAAEHKLSEALYALTAQGEVALSTALAVVLAAPDDAALERLREQTVAELHRWEGASARVMSFQNAATFLRLTPFNGRALEAGYRTLLFSQNVADLWPLLGPWPHPECALPPGGPSGAVSGHETAADSREREAIPPPHLPVLTPHGTLGRLALSGETANLGMAVLGASGSGKTFLTQHLVAAFAGQADLTLVDQKRDYTRLVQALGGAVIPLAPGGVTVNLFDLERGETEPDDTGRLFLRAVLRVLAGEDAPPESRPFENALLEEAVTAYYRVRALRGPTLTPMSEFVRVLSDLNDVSGQPMTPELRRLASGLAFKLSGACGSSTLGRLLDAPSSVDLSSAVLYFDASPLRDDPTLARLGMLLVSHLLWRRTRRAPRDRRKLAVLEEFGVFAHLPEARDFAAQLFKVGRGYHLHPLAVTQELGDFEAVRGILNNVSTVFLAGLSRPEAQGVCALLGLNPVLADTVAHLARGQYLTVRKTPQGGLEGEVLELVSSPEHHALFRDGTVG